MAAPWVGAEVGGDPKAAGRVATVIGVLFGLAGAGTSAVSVALPELAVGLGVEAASAAWVISGYAVALAVLTAVHGRIADIVGLRGPLVTGVSLMAAGALAAATAPTFPVLVAGRVLQGVGAAAVPVLGMALISARWDGAIRASALGRVTGVATVLSCLGPVLGGGLDTAGGWRWTLVLPVAGLFALPVLWRAAPTGSHREHFDVTGAVFVAIAATGLVLLIQSPATGAVVAAVGALLLATGVPATLLWIRARPDGFLPRTIVTNGVVLRSAFASASLPAGWFALLVAVPLVLAARGWTPLGMGLILAPPALLGLIIPSVARWILPRWGAARTLAVACPVTVVALLVAALGAATGVSSLLVVAVAALSVAFGIGQPAMILTVSGAVDEALRGVALGVATLLFLAGAGIGASTVGGFSEMLGFSGALSVLALLPITGTVVMLWQLRAAARTSGQFGSEWRFRASRFRSVR
ncbi:MAG TPA: MFS transporter [Pseudonocardiaceae bacterium]|nr:MFS transporter [Pseudonocardiaceae bacterium]